MLIEEDGSYVGAISGGCLERDVVRGAWAFVAQGPATVEFDTRSSAFYPAGPYGTGCEGVVKVLLQELPVKEGELDVLGAIRTAQEGGEPLVVGHIYEGTGKYAESVGATAVWSPRGQHGECLRDERFPTDVLREAEGTASGVFEREGSLGLVVEKGESRAELLLEFIPAPVELLILGAGRDVEALVAVAKPLGWRLRVAALDPLKLNGERFPDVERHLLESPDGVSKLEISPHTRIVVMTHNLAFDTLAMPALLNSAARYVGLLGPKSRAGRVLGNLHEQGLLPGASLLEKLVAPAGLDLGGDDPWQVGLSIVAQIAARSNGRAGGDLRARPGPIHRPHEVRRGSNSEERG